MHFPVYDQHRPRLRGEVCLRSSLYERAGFQDARDLSGHVKHAVWSHVEVTGTRACVGTHQLPTLLDVQADRGVVLVVHATVCREKEAPGWLPSARGDRKDIRKGARPVFSRTA